MEINQAKKILDHLYLGINGYDISAKARQKMVVSDKAFTYGEVIPDQFHQILSFVKPKPNEVFYDLGSGLGKPTFLASMLFDFSKATGIELLADLWQVSEKVLERFEKDIRPGLDERKKAQTIDFVNENFLDYDFSDGDIIFTHSTCFSFETLEKLARKVERLKQGARIITITKTIESPFLQLLGNGEFLMNWGRATAYFYQKII